MASPLFLWEVGGRQRDKLNRAARNRFYKIADDFPHP
jgi:hypothetical protein